jgi:hypothetical protein
VQKKLNAEIHFLKVRVEKNGKKKNIPLKFRIPNGNFFWLTRYWKKLRGLSNCGSHLAFAQKLWRLEAKIHFGEPRNFGRSSLPDTAVGMGDAQKRHRAKLQLKVRCF